MDVDAELVWRTWRRILREPELQEAMFAPGFAASPAAASLDQVERDVVEQYARAEPGTRFFIENYRFRMRSSFLNALDVAGPLTLRLLQAHDVDVDALGVAFLDSVGWLDHGPWVYTFGAKVLAFVLDRPELARLPGLRAVVALEQAAVRVVTGAVGVDRDAPEPAPGPRWRAADHVEAVAVDVDVSGWLRDPATLGRTDPPVRPRSYLVLLRSTQEKPRIVAVPRRAADVVDALREPRTREELAAVLGPAPGGADDDALLERLIRLGAVVAPADR